MKKNELTKAMKEVIALMVSQLFNGMSDEDIITANTTEKIGDRECTPELLTDLLGFAKEESKANVITPGSIIEKPDPNAKIFGNNDKGKKHPQFPASWEDSVIARISQSSKIGPKASDVVEIPSSVEYRPFEKSLFDTHVKQGMFDKMNLEIIHDPR